MTTRRASVLALALALVTTDALAQPAPSPTPADSAPAPAAQAPAPAAPADATRGAGMRAYLDAMARRRLGSSAPIRRRDLAARVAEAESLVSFGRHDEAIAKLTEIVEHPRFDLVEDSEEGRAALYLLGHALARAGVHESARAYLKKSIALKGAWASYGPYARRAVQRLVEIALETREYQAGLDDLAVVPTSAPAEVRAEIAYVRGRAREAAGDPEGALRAYASIPQSSRFWSQANYLSGLIEVERGRMKQGEDLFCKVADPKRQDQTTPVFADQSFFAVRDLARLALGRVAHEQSRFDDARYYYYLVPRDSDRLAEALYESATSRYEKKDYERASELLDELRALKTHHRYEDEALVLGAYIDLARCKFPEADAKLKAFLARYEPVRDAARRLRATDAGTRALLAAARSGADAAGAASASASVTPEQLRALAALVRVDPAYGEIARKRAVLEREASGLRLAMETLGDMQKSLATTGGVRPAEAERGERGGPSAAAKAEQVRAAIDGVRRQLDDLVAAHAPADKVAAFREELARLEARLPRGARAASAAADEAAKGADLPDLLRSDAAKAARFSRELEGVRAELADAETALAKDALTRLDMRLSRLLRRARLGRIESVLGKKRALEVEIEAINAGYLPQDAVDSLDAARYLKDNEEYWPFEGDDWPDEFVGSEGLE